MTDMRTETICTRQHIQWNKKYNVGKYYDEQNETYMMRYIYVYERLE